MYKMNNVRIIVVGHIKNKSLKDEIDRLSKRVSRLEIQTLKECKNKSIDEIKKQEEKAIISKLPEDLNQVYLLKEDGKEFTTQQFYYENKNKSLIFVISGPYGPSENLQNKIPNHLSLSKMTFTHEQALYLLVEQLYRIETIDKNKDYHK